MEIFISAPQGAGKSTLAQSIALDHVAKNGGGGEIVNYHYPSDPFWARRVVNLPTGNAYIFEEIPDDRALSVCRMAYAFAKEKPLCIYVVQFRINTY